MQPQTFYSNGKLLLTGEYLVIDGAKALAIPTKKGQSLSVKETEGGSQLIWKSWTYETNAGLTFNFLFQNFSIEKTSMRINQSGCKNY